MAGNLAAQLQALLDLVASRAEGVTLADIVSELPAGTNKRTVQRWLRMLREADRIQATGGGHDTRYTVAKVPAVGPVDDRALAASRSSAGATPVEATSAPGAPAAFFGLAADPRPVDERVFDCVLGNVIQRPQDRAATLLLAQGLASAFGVPPADRRACVARTLARLDALTADQAAGYGCEPEQYANWRAKYDAPPDDANLQHGTSTLQPRTTEATEPGAATFLSAVGSAKVEVAPSDLSTSKPRPDRGNAEERKRGTAPAPGKVSAFSSQLSALPSATTPSAPPTRAEAFITRAMGTGRQLATPARAAISAGWGAALSLSVDAIGAQGPTWLVTAPLAAIPSLVFLARDRLSANQSLDAPSVAAALTAGGGALALGKSLAMMAHGAWM